MLAQTGLDHIHTYSQPLSAYRQRSPTTNEPRDTLPHFLLPSRFIPWQQQHGRGFDIHLLYQQYSFVGES